MIRVAAHLRLKDDDPLVADREALHTHMTDLARSNAAREGKALPEALEVRVSTAQEADARNSFERVPAGYVLVEAFPTAGESARA